VPGAARAGMFTANSMNCMSEASPGLAGKRDHPGGECGPNPSGQNGGMKVMELLKRNIKPGHCHSGGL